MNINKLLNQLEKGLLFLVFFLFPLIISTALPNAFYQPKLIILAGAVVFLLIIKAVRIVIKKELRMIPSSFDSPLFLLVLAYLLSVVIISPNKIDALLDPGRGALTLVLLLILFLGLPRNREIVLFATLASMIVLLFTSIASYLLYSVSYLKA